MGARGLVCLFLQEVPFFIHIYPENAFDFRLICSSGPIHYALLPTITEKF